MNKNDIRLIFIVLIISIICLLTFNILKNNELSNNKKALVYYENKLIKEIDLTIKEEKEYIVNGYNGSIFIKTEYGRIKVEEENSPLNICSKQGFISSSFETIVCLPNKIVIKIKYDDKIDTIVR